MDNKTTQKTIRMENEMIERIEKLAKEADRTFSKQVIFMLKQYLKLIEDNKR